MYGAAEFILHIINLCAGSWSLYSTLLISACTGWWSLYSTLLFPACTGPRSLYSTLLISVLGRGVYTRMPFLPPPLTDLFQDLNRQITAHNDYNEIFLCLFHKILYIAPYYGYNRPTNHVKGNDNLWPQVTHCHRKWHVVTGSDTLWQRVTTCDRELQPVTVSYNLWQWVTTCDSKLQPVTASEECKTF